jgi:hypothetical protein
MLSFVGAKAESNEELYVAPPWCKEGYVCLTAEEAKDTAIYISDLEHIINNFKIRKQKRFGWTVGVGGSIGPTLEEFELSNSATVGLAAVWGFRF